MMERAQFFSRWSELHGGAEVKGVVRWWLNWAFRISRSLAVLRIRANGLTSLGLLLGAALLAALANSRADQPRWIGVAISLLILSLIADGVDGSLALITSSTSRFGAAFDAISDRIVESFWALALVIIGADHRIVLIAWLIAQIQEYIRARMGGLGVEEIGLVTPGERPVRAIFLFVALVVTLIYALNGQGEILGFAKGAVVSFVASIWLAIQFVSIILLARYAVKVLKQNP